MHIVKSVLLMVALMVFICFGQVVYVDDRKMQKGDLFNIRHVTSGDWVYISQNRWVMSGISGKAELRASRLNSPPEYVFMRDRNDQGKFEQNRDRQEEFSYAGGLSKPAYMMRNRQNKSYHVTYCFSSGIVTHCYCWIKKGNEIWTTEYTNTIGQPNFAVCDRFSFHLTSR